MNRYRLRRWWLYTVLRRPRPDRIESWRVAVELATARWAKAAGAVTDEQWRTALRRYEDAVG